MEKRWFLFRGLHTDAKYSQQFLQFHGETLVHSDVNKYLEDFRETAIGEEFIISACYSE